MTTTSSAQCAGAGGDLGRRRGKKRARASQRIIAGRARGAELWLAAGATASAGKACPMSHGHGGGRAGGTFQLQFRRGIHWSAGCRRWINDDSFRWPAGGQVRKKALSGVHTKARKPMPPSASVITLCRRRALWPAPGAQTHQTRGLSVPASVRHTFFKLPRRFDSLQHCH